jgi:hypothetical protein
MYKLYHTHFQISASNDLVKAVKSKVKFSFGPSHQRHAFFFHDLQKKCVMLSLLYRIVRFENNKYYMSATLHSYEI